MLQGRIFYIFLISLGIATSASAVTTRNTGARSATASPTAAYNYNYMYPYLNNQMRTDLNPGVTPSQGSNPINVITRTEQLSAPRRVVSRTNARSATSAATTYSSTNARAATTNTVAGGTTRRVVARAGTTTHNMAARSSRGDASQIVPVTSSVSQTEQTASNAIAAAALNTTESLPSARCLADYTECMNGYCQREKTAYNRCYCSAKLAQIDAQYQPEIDSLIQQILRLQSSNTWSDAEMNEYWMETIGKYTGDNSWVKLDNALQIDWASTESRVRGQQTFAVGHDYCVQHLRGCGYMATNMRDAYRSEIARDCATYESGLAKIKNAAESIVESYSD